MTLFNNNGNWTKGASQEALRSPQYCDSHNACCSKTNHDHIGASSSQWIGWQSAPNANINSNVAGVADVVGLNIFFSAAAAAAAAAVAAVTVIPLPCYLLLKMLLTLLMLLIVIGTRMREQKQDDGENELE